MNILVACEESQRVTIELRKRGHNAFSCDILPPSGGHPEWHILGDVIPLINGNCQFLTIGGVQTTIEGKWDMIIAFPPCTHLAVSGARHFEKKRANGKQRDGIQFFCNFLKANCDKIVIENPVDIIGGGEYIKQHFPDLSADYGLPIKPTQIIQPYEYGEPAKKTTCLWIKGLNPLIPTSIVEPKLVKYKCQNGKTATFSEDYCVGVGDRAKRRSKTYIGIAKAMAEQWTPDLTRGGV